MHERTLIKECKRYNKLAQKELYEKYANILRGVCARYTPCSDDAEDLLHECFIKIFANIKKFAWKGEGSLKGWMIRIVVNTAITNYNKNRRRKHELDYENIQETKILDNESEEINIDPEYDIADIDPDKIDYELVKDAEFTEADMLDTLNMIPEGFRVVFNLHIVEGYKHEEIAKMIGIETKTSRSRLSRARKLIQFELYQMTIKKMGK